MRVILLRDVDKVGRAYEIKEVSDGYARNFLLPHKLAKIAAPQALKELELYKQKSAREQEQKHIGFESLAHKLQGVKVIIKAKAVENGTLYGSVGSREIAEALGKMGHEVNPKQIVIEKPIKEVGKHDVMIKLFHDMQIPVKIIVGREL